MRVISSTDISREGNDCYIYESVSLVEQFGIYSVIEIQKISGWSHNKEVNVLCVTTDLKQAKKTYKEHKGVYEEYDSSDVYF